MSEDKIRIRIDRFIDCYIRMRTKTDTGVTKAVVCDGLHLMGAVLCKQSNANPLKTI